jgi:putative iron-regulated protein
MPPSLTAGPCGGDALRRRPWLAVLLVLSLAPASGCRARASDRKISPANAAAVLRGYADLAFAEYSDAAGGARVLAAAVESFVREPSAPRLDACRRAWVAARIPYAQTEAFRFYGGPIDGVEMLVNTWPIDENYVDSPNGKQGIVNDAATLPEITEASLSALNVKEGETSVTAGFHVIEFLLWGQDRNADGPGNRPYTDFVVDAAEHVAGPSRAGTPREPTSAGRRRLYVLAATRLLTQNLETVAAAWQDGAPSGYRSWFLALPPAEALGLVIKGMGALSGPELAGERLTVAYATKAQENEHSCFSDNTQADITLDALGIQNVCTGTYRRTGGAPVEHPGLCGLVSGVDAALGKQLADQLEASVRAARSIPSPFDRAILGKDSDPGRIAIQRTITALETQAETLSRAAAALGARLPVSAGSAR